MNFRDRHPNTEPEINLIPLIDVLLVMLVFLAVSSSFKQVSELEVSLPELSQQALSSEADEFTIAIGEDGSYAINGKLINATDAPSLALALKNQVTNPQTKLIIHADAAATHQSVVNVLEAARQANIARVNFAASTQNSPADTATP